MGIKASLIINSLNEFSSWADDDFYDENQDQKLHSLDEKIQNPINSQAVQNLATHLPKVVAAEKKSESESATKYKRGEKTKMGNKQKPSRYQKDAVSMYESEKMNLYFSKNKKKHSSTTKKPGKSNALDTKTDLQNDSGFSDNFVSKSNKDHDNEWEEFCSSNELFSNNETTSKQNSNQPSLKPQLDTNIERNVSIKDVEAFLGNLNVDISNSNTKSNKKHNTISSIWDTGEQLQTAPLTYSKQFTGYTKSTETNTLNEKNDRGQHYFTLVVPITKSRQAPIHIHRNDNVKDIVSEFCKVWRIPNDIKNNLVTQLSVHKNMVSALYNVYE
ncbi:hypothetical protein BB559_002792 [Furculomyces boomerangus]|uniref:Uncharacterized protein n=1 Tax=Furculomyces boomerangus TaxID=61424 RepID=A0A2T9YSF6_9FUNG|nr:hypothetical protein BB559_002792 [Furculomyces boomerangus]